MTQILDGKRIRDDRKERLAALFKEYGTLPALAIIESGHSKESAAFVVQKKNFAAEIGVPVVHVVMKEDSTAEDFISQIEVYNRDVSVGGIIVQLPLRNEIEPWSVINTIAPQKDVDGITASNLGLLVQGRAQLIPATARGIITLFDYYGISLEGKNVLVIGRSTLVGKPVALGILSRDASVSIAHSKSRSLGEKIRTADVIVSAVGSPHFINPEWVHKDQVIVDVGITVTETPEGVRVLRGDGNFEVLKEKVHAMTPVPGGVGPLTVLSLFENLYDCIKKVSKTL